jgi:hypothetical protein
VLVDVSRSFTAYWETIASVWGQADLMLIEHDIVIRPEVPAEFDACPNPWCLYPYWRGGWMDNALGCTRFRKELQLAVTPGEIQEECWGSCWECNPTGVVPAVEGFKDLRRWRAEHGSEILGCWRHIDGKITWALNKRGFAKPCIHVPPVGHAGHPVPEGVTYDVPDRD